jgi:hypothetical protein
MPARSPFASSVARISGAGRISTQSPTRGENFRESIGLFRMMCAVSATRAGIHPPRAEAPGRCRHRALSRQQPIDASTWASLARALDRGEVVPEGVTGMHTWHRGLGAADWSTDLQGDCANRAVRCRQTPLAFAVRTRSDGARLAHTSWASSTWQIALRDQ